MFRGFNRGRSRGNRQNLGVLLLAFQIFQYGIDRIPIVTLITLLTNIGVYLHVPELFDISLPKVRDICISYRGVVDYREYNRLVLSGFYHLSDMHLYYNMASFLYKGTKLEPRLGTARFATVIGSLVVGSSVVYCALQYLAAQVLGDSHLHSCAAGFSCVLFGLKVIMQSTSPPSHRLFGIPIHMAYWSELVWISIISPNVSFVGHLAGIVTGLLMTRGPLNFLLTGETPRFFEGGVRNQRTWGSGVASGNSAGRPTNRNSHTNYNNEAEEAELQEAIRRSLEEENNPRRSAPRSNSEPRGYTPTGYTPGRLYPDLPPQPSAPPPEDYSSHDQYSHPGDGYRGDGYQGDGYRSNHDPSQAPGLPTDIDEIRRRRVQRFQ